MYRIGDCIEWTTRLEHQLYTLFFEPNVYAYTVVARAYLNLGCV